jgi:PAS domain S-box-containing protein
VRYADLLETVLAVVAEPICVVDAEGRVIGWNQAAAGLTGISSDQIRERVFLEVLPAPADVKDWRREFDRISAGASPRHFESRWKSRDRSLLSLTCFCSVIRDSAGIVEYTVCTITDSISRELMKERTAELRDISIFIHNTISQDLVALSFMVPDPDPAALELIDRCCHNIRVLSCMLASPLLSETPLEEAIEMYVRHVSEETGLAVSLDIDPVSSTVLPEGQQLFFAAIQACLVRGMRSRFKPRIAIRLRNPGSATVLKLEVVSAVSTLDFLGGWAAIRERARTLGGEFGVVGDSTRVSAKLSLPVRLDYEPS